MDSISFCYFLILSSRQVTYYYTENTEGSRPLITITDQQTASNPLLSVWQKCKTSFSNKVRVIFLAAISWRYSRYRHVSLISVYDLHLTSYFRFRYFGYIPFIPSRYLPAHYLLFFSLHKFSSFEFVRVREAFYSTTFQVLRLYSVGDRQIKC